MKPDLVLMDLSMPKTNGVDAIREIKKRFPDIKVNENYSQRKTVS
jgi:DNA-binding NarL/FixJ family response regulator